MFSKDWSVNLTLKENPVRAYNVYFLAVFPPLQKDQAMLIITE
jgi:hypothetical protein